MMSRRWLVGGMAVVGAFVGIPAAEAVFQAFTASGTITSITSGSELESVLSVGDPFLAVAVYDDDLLDSSGDGTIVLNPAVNAGHSFDLTIGDPAAFTFDETDDEDFSGGDFPTIQFAGGVFTTFDFQTDFNVNVGGVDFQFDLNGDGLHADREDGEITELTGEINSTSQEPMSPD